MEPLVHKKLVLEKYPGKGGWTFVRVPKITSSSKSKFGFVTVKGTIDGFAISKYNIMPMKDGHHFLPVRAEIRKKIKKEAGDTIEVILFEDRSFVITPDELLTCLSDEPQALKFFESLSESNRKYYIEWIYSAKKVETKVNSIAKTIELLLKGRKLYDPPQ